MIFHAQGMIIVLNNNINKRYITSKHKMLVIDYILPDNLVCKYFYVLSFVTNICTYNVMNVNKLSCNV